jgi:hypothetical protein
VAPALLLLLLVVPATIASSWQAPPAKPPGWEFANSIFI